MDRTTAVATLLSPFFALSAFAAPPTRSFRETALSPDGRMIAWVGPSIGSDTRTDGFLVGALGGKIAFRRLTAGPNAGEHDLAWSPDGSRIAFVASPGDGPLAVYVASVASGAVRRVTTVKGYVASPRWSPDGRELAFLFIENAAKPAGPLVAMARDTGVIGRTVDHQRIAILTVATGQVRLASPADLYVHEYQWSPDGTRFAAAAGPGPGDSGWYVDEIWVIETKSGRSTSLGKPGFQICSPVWSPDGKSIAYLGGLMSDEVAPGGDVYLISADGGQPKNLTPDIGISPDWLAWPAGSAEILFTAWADGGAAIGSVNPTSGKVETTWSGAETLRALGDTWAGSLALSRDGSVSAVIRSSFEHPPELWTGPIGSWTSLTHVNRELSATWGTAKSLHWKSDQLPVQGWLLEPKTRSASGRNPMVVVVHGGPAAAHGSHWLTASAATELALLEKGYFVFLPNPRGSQGFGQSFTRANVKDFGYGDLRDIVAGVDEVVRSAPVDSAAVGITGWSYGGYMTMWTVTQTQRFHAAVAGAGVANWLSYWAQNGINDWLTGYFGGATVYDDPALYARSAPITYIKQAKTPTLVLVGERDIETPAPQSYEFWKGLQSNGTPTELVVYADEGHGVRQPAHVKDRIERSLAWFDKYLRPRPVP